MAKFVIPRPPASEFDSRVKQWKRVVPEDSARTLSRFFWLSGARGAGPKGKRDFLYKRQKIN